MIEKFKEALKISGRTQKWFYDSFIKEKTGLGYGGFCAQINGYVTLSNPVKVAIIDYMESGEK